MARSLFSHQGAQIITSLLNQVAQCEEASTVEDTLGILLHQFAYKQGFLPSLLACMANEPAQAAANGGSEARKCSQRGMCVEQSTALQILTDELEAANEDRYVVNRGQRVLMTVTRFHDSHMAHVVLSQSRHHRPQGVYTYAACPCCSLHSTGLMASDVAN